MRREVLSWNTGGEAMDVSECISEDICVDI
jgi:hypothetical protein